VTEHAVVIAGGGPTGMMLAAELALAGVDAVIVERRLTQEVDGSRAGGLHARTIEVLDQRGMAERFLAEGQVHPAAGYAYIPLDLGDFPSRHNCVLALWQGDFERILAGWVEDLGVPVLRGRGVLGLAQDDGGVEVELSGGGALRAGYLVGCDGGRSVVRKTAGIDFPGLPASTSWMIAEVDMAEQPELGFRRDGAGRQHAIGQRQPGEPVRAVLVEDEAEHDAEPTIDDLRALLVSVYGTDFGLRSATWIPRFTDMTRQAAAYRQGRVLLAGDAAHVHPPQGGQGLNTGVQDAVNLGWKLAQVVNGISPDDLLDTYHAERHPVAARVLHNTNAQVALGTPGDRHQALRDTIVGLLATDEARRRTAGMITALDIHYDLGPGHPLIGRRMPDLDMQTAGGASRVYEHLHDARPVLLDLGAGIDLGPWAGRVKRIEATSTGEWELPVLGAVPAPAAVLVRPDGHVAWTGDVPDADLPVALATWCGPAAP
jgi:3-(3-hydroxy-phenyl)propionate hydroxylase